MTKFITYTIAGIRLPIDIAHGINGIYIHSRHKTDKFNQHPSPSSFSILEFEV